VDAASSAFSVLRQTVRSSRCGPFCLDVDDTTGELQQSLPRPNIHGGGCSEPEGLESNEQLCKPTVSFDTLGARCNTRTASTSHLDCSVLASPELVSSVVKHDHCYASSTSHDSKNIMDSKSQGGASTQPKMESVGLACLWQERAERLGWPERAAKQLSLAWAPSTLHLYDRLSTRFVLMCQQQDFTKASSKDVAVFLCDLADKSDRPASQLKSDVAAINCMYDAVGLSSPAKCSDISRLQVALTKSATTVPAIRTPIMPLEPFFKLFTSWPVNSALSIQDLRLKAITLMAITFMARPSDLAPKGVAFDPITLSTKDYVFSADNVEFHMDGSMTVWFFGTKNDTRRTGFEVHVPGANEEKVDPVRCL